MMALKDLDYFVPNESEAETITGQPVKTVEDARKCAEKLVDGGINRVIITLGANGSLLARPRRDRTCRLPSPCKSIDSTGAGDAFIGSFAVFLRRRLAGKRSGAPRESVRGTLDHGRRNAKIVLPALELRR